MFEKKLFWSRQTEILDEDAAALRWRSTILKLSQNLMTAADERQDLSPVLMEALHHALENLLLLGDEADLLALEEWLDLEIATRQESDANGADANEARISDSNHSNSEECLNVAAPPSEYLPIYAGDERRTTSRRITQRRTADRRFAERRLSSHFSESTAAGPDTDTKIDFPLLPVESETHTNNHGGHNSPKNKQETAEERRSSADRRKSQRRNEQERRSDYERRRPA